MARPADAGGLPCFIEGRRSGSFVLREIERHLIGFFGHCDVLERRFIQPDSGTKILTAINFWSKTRTKRDRNMSKHEF
jgi:hypothetical protein